MFKRNIPAFTFIAIDVLMCTLFYVVDAYEPEGRKLVFLDDNNF